MITIAKKSPKQRSAPRARFAEWDHVRPHGVPAAGSVGSIVSPESKAQYDRLRILQKVVLEEVRELLGAKWRLTPAEERVEAMLKALDAERERFRQLLQVTI